MATSRRRRLSLFPRRQESDAELDERLLAAYHAAKNADDGRRVDRKNLRVEPGRRV
jgi:hypothetical protein